MKKTPKAESYHSDNKKRKILTWLIVAQAVLLIGLIILALYLNGYFTKPEPEATVPTTVQTEPTTQPTQTTQSTTEPTETEPQMIEWMADLYEQNPDFAYWVEIPDTPLSHPVMYTPEDPEKYIHKTFEGEYSSCGIPFLEDVCDISDENESDNLIIYGHNISVGGQFRTLFDYTDQEYWEEHPQVKLTTMWEERTYDILAVFYDRVYYQNENVFKFYKFVDAEDEDDFKRAIDYYKQNALYDTGVTASYGDRLLTLVTCSYHRENGRFVLVARQSMEEPES